MIEVLNLAMCAILGCVTVLIFRPESYWSRMMVGATMGLLVWIIKVTAIWWSYRA